MNVFASAQKKASKPEPKGKKKNEVIIEIPKDDVQMTESVDTFVEACKKIKSAESDKKIASGYATPQCLSEFLGRFAESGVKPDSIKFRTVTGNTVTFIAQDRAGNSSVSEEMQATLVNILGEKKTESMIERETKFSFNSAILEKEGVVEALGAKMQELADEGVITEQELEGMIKAENRAVFKKGILDRLATLADNDVDIMDNVIGAVGSNITTYIKS